MHKFTFSPGKAAQLRRKYFNQVAIFIGIAAAGGVITSSLKSNGAYQDVRFLPLFFLVMGLPLGYGLLRAYKRAKAYYEGYLLTIDTDTITHTQPGYQDVVLYKNDVIAIGQYPDGGFAVATDKGQLIIPAGLSDHDELCSQLASIKPLETTTRLPFFFRYRNAILITVLGAYICFLTMKDKIVIASLGSVLTVLLVWAGYKVWSSPAVDQRIKRKLWIMFLLLFSLIARTVLVLKS